MSLRTPAEAWSLSSALLLWGALALPTALALADEHDSADLLSTAGAVLLVVAALTSSGLFIVHSRWAGNQQTLWAGIVLAAVALAGSAHSVITLTHGASDLAPSETVMVWLIPLLAVVVVVLIAAVHQLDTLPAWARNQAGVGTALAGGSLVVSVAARPLSGDVRALSLLVALAGALLIASTSAALVRQLAAATTDQLHDLQRRLAATESANRAHHARLHDATSLVAGIASASHLVRDLAPSPRRDALEQMMVDEIERLQRLLEKKDPASHPTEDRPTQDVDVDEVVGRVVLSHCARGRSVGWAPSGLRVRGDVDDLAQLLDILVDNAARHGTPHDIDVRARRTPAHIAISVSDGGPGVPPQLVSSLFAWGARAAGSTGEGIGLHTAQGLAERLGGSIHLGDEASGTRFTLALPDPGRTHAGEPEDGRLAAH